MEGAGKDCFVFSLSSTDNSENQLYSKTIILQYYNPVLLKYPLFICKLANQLSVLQVEEVNSCMSSEWLMSLVK